MESTGVLRGRRRSTGERKSIERRRSRSQSRKSGPKVIQAAREGRDERRRMSDSHRRDSKSKATTRRRERSELRPPLPGRSIIGRSSLPGRLSAPTLAPPVAIDVEPGMIDTTAVASSDNSNRIEPMQQVEDEATSIPEADWTPGMVADAARGILRGNRDLQLRSLRWIRVVLSLAPKPPAAEVVQAGLIPKLVALLRSKETPELRPEALCALTNIASTECTRAVIQEPDAIPTLKALLSGPERNLREQSAWCLGNIAADSVEMRDLVLEAGVLDPLLQILAPSPQKTTALMRTGTWALNNLCRGEPSPPLSVVLPILSVIQPIITAATTGDVGTLIDAGWILYHVTRGGSDRIDALLFHGLLSLMPDLLLHEDPQVVRPVIRAMDNLACSSGAHRGALIATGVLDPLVETLSHDSAKVRADALRLISSVAAGSYDQVAAVVSTADLIPSVVTELEEGNALCRREAAWVFLNICECGFEASKSIIPEMVENGVIAAVCQNLDPEADVESLVVMLSILYTILDDDGCSDGGARLLNYISLVEEAEGFDRTVRLMNEHDDDEVYDKAADIVRSFVDREGLEGKGDEQEGPGSRRVLRRDHSDPDLDSMSDDSLSDDSFHPELSSTTGPITPPQSPKTTERALPSATVTTDSGTIFGGKADPPAFGRDIGVAKPPRQPIGAAADLGAKESLGNAGGSGAGVWDITAETPVTGNAGKARFFGNIC